MKVELNNNNNIALSTAKCVRPTTGTNCKLSFSRKWFFPGRNEYLPKAFIFLC